jgi:hypothetical protein
MSSDTIFQNDFINAVFIILLSLVIFNIIYGPVINKYEYAINELIANNTIKPIESRPEVMDMPLCHFAINSSHNSYLGYYLSFTTVKPIEIMLKSGVRTIELDIGQIKNNPVVHHGTHGGWTTSSVPLEDMLDIILEFGFNTSDPLLIFTDIYDVNNTIVNQKIKNMIIAKFGSKNRRYGAYLEGETKQIKMYNKPIREFINKIVFFGRFDKDDTLSTVMESDENYLNVPDSKKMLLQNNPHDRLYRIYHHASLNSCLSMNYDYKQFIDRGYGIFAMNHQCKNKIMYDYYDMFKNYSYIPVDELKSTN